MNQNPEPDVRQVVVHPAVWPHLEAWLDRNGLVLSRIPSGEDDLPTYVMALKESVAKETGLV